MFSLDLLELDLIFVENIHKSDSNILNFNYNFALFYHWIVNSHFIPLSVLLALNSQLISIC